MKVLYDHQVFCFRYGGASKYFAMLIDALPKGSWETTSLMATNEYVREKKLFSTYKYRMKGQGVLADYINRPYTNYKLRHGDYDVFHQTNFGTYCLKALGNKPMVVTYHDSNLSLRDPHPEMVIKQRASLERADAIVCVSKNTKDDLMQLFSVDEKKVYVIYHGIEIPDMASLSPERMFDFPYVLYVGRRSAYKNFKAMAEAFSLVAEKYKDVHLVCTSQAFTNEEKSLFSRLGILENVYAICADESDMQRLYRDAQMFVFPSLYEGFGMPILEAWSCGCPVVLSDASCFPEIAGDAGLYFNPSDIGEMASCIEKVLTDNDLRQELRRRGDERVRLFSWQATADAHLKVYQGLL